MKNNYLKHLDRSVITVNSSKEDPLEETRFWLSKKPIERLIALELLRMRLFDYDNTSSRLQRFLTITQRS